MNFGIPRLQAGYNSYLQIVQSPGYVTIMNEMAHDARIIPLDGRPHLDSSIRVWNGDSRGHWEGDTLVIETTNFSPKSDFMGSHENLRLTEQLTRAGRRDPQLRVHGQRSHDVDGAVDRDDSAEAEERVDLRVRVPRGERRDVPYHAACGHRYERTTSREQEPPAVVVVTTYETDPSSVALRASGDRPPGRKRIAPEAVPEPL